MSAIIADLRSAAGSLVVFGLSQLNLDAIDAIDAVDKQDQDEYECDLVLVNFMSLFRGHLTNL